KSIEDFDADAEITLLNETQDDNLMFDAGVLDDEVVMPGKKEEQGTKFDDMEVSTANEAITTAGVKDSAIAPTIAAAPTITTAVEVVTIVSAPTTTIDELTLAQTLIEINAAKPKTVTAVTTTATTVTTAAVTRPKTKGVVIQESGEKTIRKERSAKIIPVVCQKTVSRPSLNNCPKHIPPSMFWDTIHPMD
ncbi:hypothetical protein Tco_0994734, partial [Tanacetum coccineum]